MPDETKGELHIRHTPEKYRENLTELVQILEKSGSKRAKLVFATTTPIMSRKEKRFKDIKTILPSYASWPWERTSPAGRRRHLFI